MLRQGIKEKEPAYRNRRLSQETLSEYLFFAEVGEGKGTSLQGKTL